MTTLEIIIATIPLIFLIGTVVIGSLLFVSKQSAERKSVLKGLLVSMLIVDFVSAVVIYSHLGVGDQILRLARSKVAASKSSGDQAMRKSENINGYLDCVAAAKGLSERELCEKQVSPEMKGLLDSGQNENLKKCVDFNKRLFAALTTDESKAPANINSMIEKSCSEVSNSNSNKPAVAELEAIKFLMLRRAWITEGLSKAVKNFNLKSELDFLPLSRDLSFDKVTCDEVKTKIQAAVQQGSSEAFMFKLACSVETCNKAKDKVCSAARQILKAALSRNIPLAYYTLANDDGSSPKEHVHAAIKAEQLGQYVRNLGVLPDERPFRFNRILALSALNATKSIGKGYGPSDVEQCAIAVLSEPWSYDGHPLEASKISNSEWMKMVPQWANKQSSNYNPMLLTKFICEISSDQKGRSALMANAFAPEIFYEYGFKFCDEIKDEKFARECGRQ